MDEYHTVEMQCTSYHDCKRDCIIDRIERNEWEEFLMKEFEDDFCCPNDGEEAEMMECYEILKRNKCMISDKTHDHAEMLKKKQQDILDSCSKKIEDQPDEMMADGADSKSERAKGPGWESWCESFRGTTLDGEGDWDVDDDDVGKNGDDPYDLADKKKKMNFLMKKFLKTRVDLYKDFIGWIGSAEGTYWLRKTPAKSAMDEVMKMQEEDEDIYLTQKKQ